MGQLNAGLYIPHFAAHTHLHAVFAIIISSCNINPFVLVNFHVALLVNVASILVKRKLLYGFFYGTQNASLHELL